MLRTGLIYSLVDICISVLFGPISKLFMHKKVINFVDPITLYSFDRKKGVVRAEYRGSIIPVEYSGDLIEGRVVSPVIVYLYFDSLANLLNYSTGFDLNSRDERRLILFYDSDWGVGSFYTLRV